MRPRTLARAVRGGGMIDGEQVARYREDGVVCMRGVFGRRWIERLRAGLARNLASPSPRGRLWNRDAQGRCCFYDSQTWMQVPEYEDFVWHSGCAEMAGRLMQSSRVNFFFDAMFVRTPGTQFRTPWHQDEPFWSVEGHDTCSVWMPLTPVARQSCLEVVRGSHRWGHRYRQTNFGALTGDARDQVRFDEDDTVPFPDIDAERERHDIAAFDMEPGDCIVFNGRCIHGGSGRLPEGRGLEVFNTKWLGDDVRVVFRETGMDPDHSAVMTEAGLGPGDRPGTALYPEVWTAGGVAAAGGAPRGHGAR